MLPLSKTEAAAITQKALDDVRSVRQGALNALGTTIGLRPADAEAYARRVDAQLEGQSYANDPGVLLAPDINAIVVRATALYAQVGDTAAAQLTQPRATATPSASPRPSASPSPRP